MDQIELGNELSVATYGWFEFRHHHRPSFHGNSVEQKILGVARFVFDVYLSNQRAVSRRQYRRMDVRCAAGIIHRPDGAKSVTAVGIRHGMAVPLKVLIHSHRLAVPGVVVAAVRIALPYLDTHAGQRAPVGVNYSTEQVRSPPLRQTAAAHHLGEVVVVVQW